MKEKKSKTLSLSHLLKEKKFPQESESSAELKLKKLQLDLLRVQQGVWQSKRRVVVVFEGFDAAGKGGAIRRVTEKIDPRGFRVYPIGPPNAEEQAKHYLYRFWEKLPAPGTVTIFDRSWYGRVLVERVEEITPKNRWKEAYDEINEFEATLMRDGIDVVKIFLAIHPEEQIKRFEARLSDPYKQWKLNKEDLRAHWEWDHYVHAVDQMFEKTHTKSCPWHLIPADSKPYARLMVFETLLKSLAHHSSWIEKQAEKNRTENLQRALTLLKQEKKKFKQ